jgi:hypothetical protein
MFDGYILEAGKLGWEDRDAHPTQLLAKTALVGPHGERFHAHARMQPLRHIPGLCASAP